MNNIKPLNEKVLVYREDMTNKTETGIIIPDVAKEKSTQGVVLSVSDDCKLPIKEGMTVIFGKYSGNTISEDENLLILDSVDIMGYKIEKED